MTQIKQTKSTHFKKVAKGKESGLGVELGAAIENEEKKYPPIGGWKGALFSVTDKCIGCKQCVNHCPEATIRMKEIGDKKQANIDAEFCKGCGVCMSVCPVSAIEMKKL